ncbi:MAG: hypothetical protein IKJ77_09235 [Firmicutes bacterium]|nr:hypothetical protein [Bacillota bacterium]
METKNEIEKETKFYPFTNRFTFSMVIRDPKICKGLLERIIPEVDFGEVRNSGSERVVPHEFDYDCQSACGDCTYTRVPLADHVYDNGCDADCNVCGNRHDTEHDYSVTKYDKATLKEDGAVWTECSICGELGDYEFIYSPGSISLSKTFYAYDGKVKSPKVIVKDWLGNTISSKYYTVKTPAGRKNVGKYTYTIAFKERYSGTEELTFTITPKATSVKKLTPAKKAFTVKLNKVSKQADGYEIMYATDSKFTKGKKTVKVPYKTTSKKISKLAAKKTYYAKVRTYKKVGGQMVYADWSKIKKVKTK